MKKRGRATGKKSQVSPVLGTWLCPFSGRGLDPKRTFQLFLRAMKMRTCAVGNPPGRDPEPRKENTCGKQEKLDQESKEK